MKLFIKKSKFIFILIFSIVFAICISISLQSLYAWSPPNNVPPICNSGEPGCDAPLHVGTSTQSKIGALIISRDPSNKNVLGLQVENGPVGIGMIFPQTPNSNSLLHLYRVIGGEPNAEIDIQSVSGANNHWGIYQDRTTSDLRFWGTGNDLVTFANEGKVGLGTITPAEALEVNPISGVSRVRITDTTAGENPELQLQYGVNDSNHWSFFVDKVDSNKLKIWNANNLFTINSAGNVGIGTTSPSQKLDVLGNINVSSAYRLNGIMAMQNTISYIQVGTENAYDLNFLAGSPNSRLWIQDTSGNVGIGTTNPAYKLDILGGSSSQIRLSNSDSDNTQKYTAIVNRDYKTANKDFLIISGASLGPANAISIGGGNASFNAATQLQFYTGPNNTVVGTERMRIDSSGNVGIGTASPGAKLEVAGQIKITGGSPGANKVLTSDADGLASWAVAPGSDSLPGGTDDQTMRWNNGAWEANSLLKVDDGGAVTITSSYDNPSARARYIFLRDSTNANLYSYIGINRNSAAGANKEYLSIEGVEETVHWLNIILGGEGGGRVGIGTKSPTNKMTVLVPNANDGVSFTDGTRWTLMAPGTVAAGSYNPIVGANDNSIIYTAGVINTGSFVIAPWSSGTASGIKIDSSGNVGIGTTTPSAKFSITGNGTGTGRLMALANSSNSDIFTVLDNGNVNIKGTVTAGAGDVAEEFSANEYLEVGTVLVMGNNGFKYARSCDKKYDQTVIGVVSENPSLLMGNVDTKYKVSVAINGVVKVKVNNKNGKIYKGDMITTSDISGQAMKATYNKLGTIIGKALENLDEDSGEIMVLVNLN